MINNTQTVRPTEGLPINAGQLAFARFDNEQCSVPSEVGMAPWPKFASRLMKDEIRKEKSGKAYAPVYLPSGARRRNENVKAVSAAVIDSDKGVSFDSVRDRFNGLAFAAHSTHSNSPAHPKWRLVMPLLKPVRAKDWPACHAGLVDRFGKDIVDTACSDAARLYYFPSCTPENADIRWAKTGEGEYLDPAPLIERGREILAIEKRPGSQSVATLNDDLTAHLSREKWPETTENIERVKSILKLLDPDPDQHGNYESWRNTVWAVAATGWDCAKALAEEWSQRGDLFDQSEFDSVWSRFDASRGIGFGTLVHYAKQAGWADPTLVLAAEIKHTLNDAGNADRFIRDWGANLRYCVELKTWMLWSKQHWHFDKRGHAVTLATATARRIYAEASEQPDSAVRDLVSKHANRSLQISRLDAMNTLAESAPGIGVSVSELDRDPWLLGVRNGVIDLKSGAFRNAQQDDLITHLANVDYEPAATCPIFMAFLNRIFCSDRALIDFVQQAIGYTLTGQTGEHVFFFLHGSGANGKTTLVNVLREMMGSYALQTQPELLMVRKQVNPGGATPELARLKGARLVAANETEEGQRLAESLVKQMTGGDAITARSLYGTPFDFIPEFKLWLCGNHRPIIRGDDHGIWRRIVLIPFDETIPAQERDKRLPDKLRSEYSGILNWAIDGCLRWQRSGLQAPARITQEVNAYRSAMDLLKQWLDEECQECDADSGQEYRARQAYQDFTRWLEGGGHQPITETRFGQKMGERGIHKKRVNSGNTYVGIVRRVRSRD